MVLVLELYFNGQFAFRISDNPVSNLTFGRIFLNQLKESFFLKVTQQIIKFQNQEIRLVDDNLFGEENKDQADNNSSNNRQLVKLDAVDDADRDGPKQKSNVFGVFDGITKTDNRESTNQSQRQGKVAADANHDNTDNQGNNDQRDVKILGVKDAGIGFFVNEINKHGHGKSDGKRKNNVAISKSSRRSKNLVKEIANALSHLIQIPR